MRCECFAPGEVAGHCPGPDACPMCAEDDDGSETLEERVESLADDIHAFDPDLEGQRDPELAATWNAWLKSCEMRTAAQLLAQLADLQGRVFDAAWVADAARLARQAETMVQECARSIAEEEIEAREEVAA